MGASMSAPTPINRVAGNIAYEFLGISPAAAGELPSAAAADHAHQIGTTLRRTTGFGLAQSFQTGDAEPGNGYVGIVTQVDALPSLSKWTIEGWTSGIGSNATTGGFNTGFGFYTATDGTNPIPTGAAPVAGIGAGAGSKPAFSFPDGSAFAPGIPTGTVHFALSCDGSATRCFVNGALVVTKPAYTLFESTGGVFGAAVDGSLGDWDEFRVSDIARYTAAFTTATAPFNPDANTLVLWHLDEGPLGQWFYETGNGGANGLVQGVATDASPNGNDGLLFYSLGGGTFDSSVSVTGVISTVTPNSGELSASAVLSLQAKTGDLVLTDTAGNSVATAVAQSDGTVQLQTSLMAFKAAWSSTTAYAVGDTVTSGGLTYVCIANNTNNVPPNATYWAAVGGGGGGTLAHTYEQEITVTTAVTALSYTPTTSGLYRISFYFRVVTAATDVTVTVTTTDATGAQTWDVLPLTSEAVDSYQLDSITVAGTAGDAIDVVVTAGTANQVYFSSSIEAG